MISYEEAGAVLDEAVDALPQEIFRELNGGVNLVRRAEHDEYGLLIMGTYFVNQMGRYIEIYYGSFCEKYRDSAPERCERELVRTLKHELTHHIESLAMDRTLERWDEQHVAELLAGLDDEEPLDIGSILFVDEKGAGLAEMACAMFRFDSERSGLDDIDSACASVFTGPLSIKAAKALSRFNINIAAGGPPQELTRELCERYDAVMCTTDALAISLASRWPDLDDKIMCIGDNDYDEPRFESQMSWNRLADKMAADIGSLVLELRWPDDEDD